VKAYVSGNEGYILEDISAKLIPIALIIQAAGWYMKKSNEEQGKPYDPGLALCWRNVTGLGPGRTSLASELSLLYTSPQIIGSCLRDLLYAVWDGENSHK
jgi:hypothetical protein